MSPRTQEWRHRALAVVSEAVRAGCVDLVCHELRKVVAEMPGGDARDRLQALELALLTKSLEGPVVLLNERSYREWAEDGDRDVVEMARFKGWEVG